MKRKILISAELPACFAMRFAAAPDLSSKRALQLPIAESSLYPLTFNFILEMANPTFLLIS
jgi:hypothetical protein